MKIRIKQHGFWASESVLLCYLLKTFPVIYLPVRHLRSPGNINSYERFGKSLVFIGNLYSIASPSLWNSIVNVQVYWKRLGASGLYCNGNKLKNQGKITFWRSEKQTRQGRGNKNWVLISVAPNKKDGLLQAFLDLFCNLLCKHSFTMYHLKKYIDGSYSQMDGSLPYWIPYAL